ncbi:uncharacterized protein LOC6576402 [Drosophila mojavensis]|uniref:DUF4771 domain-containing protein n=1 Tax=Drosophila mojavensis TaxID=7230 RepID=B4KE89_DROMO|nr:uncharacterized protein LOC6576402 [Drosophila mojavensis]EDW11834.1 uncharacterized protein Dmoj_GI17358 [Drosophila mojavensis]
MDEFQDVEESLRWYRNMSEEQFRACDALLNALRDDIDEHTTYRVEECLKALGVYPYPSSKQLKLLVDLSRGSDLAFLWFLWEAYYKDRRPSDSARQTYRCNEQLLLTGIAHLDMAMTKRGLDKILPLPEHGKKYQQRLHRLQEKLDRKERRQTEQRLNEGLNEPADDSPYMKPQVRPRRFVPLAKAFNPNERKQPSRLNDIPNERNRWFADYEISPIKREVKKCLLQAIDQIFGKEHRSVDKSLCSVHRMVQRDLVRKQHELTTDALHRCLEMVSVQSREKRVRSERIVRQLEREVMQAAKKLEMHRMQHLMKVQRSMREEAYACKGHCKMCVQLVAMPEMISPTDAKEGGCILPLLMTDQSNSTVSHGHPAPHPKDLNSIHVMTLGKEHEHKTIHLLKDDRYSCPGPPAKPVVKPVVQPEVCEKPAPKVVEDVAPEVPSTGSSSSQGDEHCFRRYMPNGRLAWNFFRIYGPTAQQSAVDLRYTDPQPIIRSYCVAALQKAMEGEEEKKAAKIYGKKHMERILWQQQHVSSMALEAAVKSARQAFRAGPSNGLADPVETPPPPRESSERLQVTNIDPENRQKLSELLNSAMDILRNDSRYVLVTLPNAHKMPELVDWVARRYGKVFRHDTMPTLTTKQVLALLKINRPLAQFPEPKDVEFRCTPDANCDDKTFLCRFEQMRKEYHTRLNERDLQDSRITWLALRNYAPRPMINPKTYFAYIPSSQRDFARRNLWLSFQFRPLDSLRKGPFHK